MKNYVLAAIVALLGVSASMGQSGAPFTSVPKSAGSLVLAAPNAGIAHPGDSLLSLVDSKPENSLKTVPFALTASPAGAPTPSSTPRFVFGSRDDFRWQLGVGYEYVRFQSSAFNANLSGLHTSLTYYTNEWFGWEGSVVAAFGGTLFANDRTKYLLYTVGPRLAWRRPKWEPWAHALVGGIHMLPQIAAQGKNGFAVQVGGGADYRFNPTVALRIEGDYVRSELYSSGQNHFQMGTGIVVHF
jgi:Outer membrane protein beta-barrel domain